MFQSASFLGTLTVTSVACASPGSMFQSTTFAGAVSIVGGSFTGPSSLFAGATLSSTFTTSSSVALTGSAVGAFLSATFVGNADLSGFTVSGLTSATNMFNTAAFQGAVATVFPGPFTLVTSALGMFQSSTYTTAPNMNAVSLPAATTISSAFASIAKLPNLPSLDLRVAATCTNAFLSSTFVNAFAPVWPLMLCSTATTMFSGTTFNAGADMSGMVVSQVVTATSMFATMVVTGAYTSPGAFSAATAASLLYQNAHANSISDPMWTMTQISLPVATTVASAFSFGTTVTTISSMPNLSLAAATDCSSAFSGGKVKFGERLVASWPSSKCSTTAANMFNSVTFTLGADFSGMAVGQIITATQMYITTIFQGATPSVFQGTFTSLTGGIFMFDGASFTTTPNMDNLSFPAVTSSSSSNFGMFSNINHLPNLPNLDLRVLADCIGLFRSSTFDSRFVPIWPNAKCTTGTSMFQSTTFTLGADLSGMRVTQIVTATSMFNLASFQSATASIMPGPFSSVTGANSMFASAAFPTTAPNMTLISIPVATTATSMFSSCAKVTALPNLNPVSLVTGTNMFTLATFVADMGASTLAWSFPVLQTATTMFQGTNFGNNAFYMHTWGMNAVTTLLNFANGATNVPNSISVSTWQVQHLTVLTGFFFGVNSPLLVLDLSSWTTTALTTMSNAFSSLTNVKLTGVNNLDVSHVTDMTSLFLGTAMTTNITLNTWNTSSVTLMTGAFQTCIGTSVDISAWNVARVVTATTMFTTSNMDPNLASWTWTALLTIATNFADQCYFSTPARYSGALISFATTTTKTGVTFGGPRNNTLTTTGNLPTRVLQGYDGTGTAPRATLVTRSWVFNDAGQR